MKNYNIKEWKDYWDIFNELIKSLENSNKENIVLEFKSSQRFLNGLTDGWYEFLNAFSTSVENNSNNLTKEQKYMSEFLISTLKNLLKNR
jgi:uncharacterized damage-inducible protein DinB